MKSLYIWICIKELFLSQIFNQASKYFEQGQHQILILSRWRLLNVFSNELQ
jgi:hypothetical protein